MTKSVSLIYYAVFREQSGSDHELLSTDAGTLRELYRDVSRSYGFKLAEELVQVAVNDRFCSLDDSFNDNDCVVFIPPVAGG